MYLDLVRAFEEACAGPQASPWRQYLAVAPPLQPDALGARVMFLRMYDRPEPWRRRKPTDRQLACLWVLDGGDFALPKTTSGFYTVAKVLDAETRAFREARRRAARSAPPR